VASVSTVDAVFASSAVLAGSMRVGLAVHVAQGAVVRALDDAVEVGAGSAVLENSVVIGRPGLGVHIGRRTVFGHRCLVVGAAVGDLCEIGNGSILLPGARLGDRCFLGEGCLIPPGAVIPDGSVVVGRPGHTIRHVTDADIERLRRLRDGDLSLPPGGAVSCSNRPEAGARMGQLYSYRGKVPEVSDRAIVFDTAEITGDVVIGADSIIGSGVRIIGDSHGPVRIGARVQILENTVLHLLPDNELCLEDDVIIGPGAMIHGCHIGAGTIVEPGAIVCDWSEIGRDCLVTAGSVVKQRDRFGDRRVLEGFPAKAVGEVPARQAVPAWAFRLGDLPSLVSVERGVQLKP
jgi:carbonic anhydrase/acetyltransferase-like protein (isoleucine patch superfamily)